MTDILVNKDQWDSLSSDEQDKISKGLIETGAIRDIDRIVGDASVPPIDESTQLDPLWNPLKDACKVVCDVAAGAALAWCTANTGGLAFAVCVAAAEAGRKACKDRC